jgi:outer membrane protein TolC
MNKIKYIFLFFFSISFCSSFAQESMMPAVSYAMLDKLIAKAKENYPKMRYFSSKVGVADANLKKSKMGWFDALTFSYIYSPNGTATATNPVGLSGFQTGVFVNFGSLLSRPAAIKQAKAEKGMASAEADEYNLNIEFYVKERYYNFIEKLTILNLRTKASEDAETSQKQLKYKFEKGEETYDNFSKSLVLFLLSTQNKIEAEGGFLTAKSKLEEIIGDKLENIK